MPHRTWIFKSGDDVWEQLVLAWFQIQSQLYRDFMKYFVTLSDLRFLQWWGWRLHSAGMWWHYSPTFVSFHLLYVSIVTCVTLDMSNCILWNYGVWTKSQTTTIIKWLFMWCNKTVMSIHCPIQYNSEIILYYSDKPV